MEIRRIRSCASVIAFVEALSETAATLFGLDDLKRRRLVINHSGR
jgi:hypothetical protein